MTEKERAKELAEAHWEYVGGLLESHGVSQEFVDGAAYNYITAFEHAYMHAIEDERNGMFITMGAARYAEIHTPLTTGEIAAIARPCSECLDEAPCQGGLRLSSGDCLHYRLKVAKSCRTCDSFDRCPGGQSGAKVCMGWTEKVADQQYPKVAS